MIYMRVTLKVLKTGLDKIVQKINYLSDPKLLALLYQQTIIWGNNFNLAIIELIKKNGVNMQKNLEL